jgi:PilZ domain-containing protein
MSSQERRKNRRYEVDIPTRLLVAGESIDVRLKDVCRDAILVESPQTWPLGTPVGVALGLPDGQSPVEVHGKVIRLAAASGGEGPGVAVLFTEVSPELAARLDFFFASLD